MKRPWMPLYVADILLSEEIASLPDDAFGVYVKLLCHNWDKGDLPSDPDRLARLLHKNPRSFRRIWEIIRHLFPDHSPGRVANDRVVNELKRADEKSVKSVKAANIRHHCHADALPYTTHHSTTQHSTVNTDTTDAASPRVPVFDLEAIYREYPRKVGRKKGIAALKAQIKTQADYDTAMQGVVSFVTAMQSERRPTDKIPHFSTWATQEQWRDYAVLPLSSGTQYTRFRAPQEHQTETKDETDDL